MFYVQTEVACNKMDRYQTNKDKKTSKTLTCPVGRKWIVDS